MAVTELKARNAKNDLKNVRVKLNKRDHIEESLMGYGKYKRYVSQYDKHIVEADKHLARAGVIARQLELIERRFKPERKPKREIAPKEGEIPK